MGGQITDEGLVEIRFDQYLFQVRVISQSEVGLDAIDTKTFQTFTIEAHHFANHVNSSTLIAALNRKETDNLKIIISHGQTDMKEPLLKVILRVTFDFLPHFDETIILPLKKGVSEKDMVSTQLKLINSEIVNLSQQIDGYSNVAGVKYTQTVSQGMYNGASHAIAQLELPKGKYEISIQFYTQSSQNWIYMRLINSTTGTCCLKIPEQGFYFTLANSSYYQPQIIRSIADITTERATLSLDSTNCQSYPWNMKNLILSATQI